MKKIIFFVVILCFPAASFADILTMIDVGTHIDYPKMKYTYYKKEVETLTLDPFSCPRVDLEIAYDPGHYFIGGEIGGQKIDIIPRMDILRVGAIGGYFFLAGTVRPYLATGVGYSIFDTSDTTIEFTTFSIKGGLLGSIGAHLQMGGAVRFEYMLRVRAENRDPTDTIEKKLVWSPIHILYEIGFRF